MNKSIFASFLIFIPSLTHAVDDLTHSSAEKLSQARMEYLKEKNERASLSMISQASLDKEPRAETATGAAAAAAAAPASPISLVSTRLQERRPLYHSLTVQNVRPKNEVKIIRAASISEVISFSSIFETLVVTLMEIYSRPVHGFRATPEGIRDALRNMAYWGEEYIRLFTDIQLIDANKDRLRRQGVVLEDLSLEKSFGEVCTRKNYRFPLDYEDFKFSYRLPGMKIDQKMIIPGNVGLYVKTLTIVGNGFLECPIIWVADTDGLEAPNPLPIRAQLLIVGETIIPTPPFTRNTDPTKVQSRKHSRRNQG